MRDFTFRAYNKYIDAIIDTYKHILRFDEYFNLNSKPDHYAIIRHDVDRMPYRALNMARFENEKGIKSTYYFRAKFHTFKPYIIKEIYGLGHEIGYHYESLSDMGGGMSKALEDFEGNLNKFREIVPVRTISMHGRPFNNFDNREMWIDEENKNYLINKLGILGELYLDINYSNIAYINDTGRNWHSTRSNLRDKINSTVNADFENGKDLYDALRTGKFDKLVFQIHPERWSENKLQWYSQWLNDGLVNIAKNMYNKLGQ